jgi:CRP-like cAMP-binding protein
MRALSEAGCESGKELGEFMRGETVGELAFLSRTPRSATLVAVHGGILAKAMSRWQ